MHASNLESSEGIEEVVSKVVLLGPHSLLHQSPEESLLECFYLKGPALSFHGDMSQKVFFLLFPYLNFNSSIVFFVLIL